MSDFAVVDLETTGKTPWTGRILRVGIGETPHRMPKGRQLAALLLARPGVVVTHTGFDLRFLALDGCAIHAGVELHDTRTMAWLLEEEGPFDLEALMGRWLGRTIVKPIKQVKGRIMFQSARLGKLVPIEDVPDDEMDEYNAGDLRDERDLYLTLRDALRREGLWEQFLRDEVPLARMILDMEVAGLPFDLPACDALREKVSDEADELEGELVGAIGAPIKLSSPDQVGKYLFTKTTFKQKASIRMTDEMLERLKGAGKKKVEALAGTLPPNFEVDRVGRTIVHGFYSVKGRGLPAPRRKEASGAAAVKKLKGGESVRASRREIPGVGSEWSTSSTDLVLLNAEDTWVQDFVLWRELDKLRGSFLSRFPSFIGPDGRMHGTFSRTGTVTGRFSSSEPNLQNIPAHGRYGGDVRGLVKGALAIGDFAQLEQRITAHLSGDENLIKAYQEDIDLYGLAASLLFGGEALKEHPQRGLLKTTMLSLAYGAGYAKLAMLMTRGGFETDADGARELVRKIVAAFPRMFENREEIVLDAIARGYTETLGGRKRRLAFVPGWDIQRQRFMDDVGFVDHTRMSRDERNDPTIKLMFTLERQASNAKVQGSAADIAAGSMIAAERAAEPGEFRTLLQVHDEVVWERGENWAGAASLAKLKWACEEGHGFKLIVPLKFEPAEAESWAEKGATQTGEGHVVKDRLAKARSDGMHSRKASDYAADRREMRKQKEGANA